MGGDAGRTLGEDGIASPHREKVTGARSHCVTPRRAQKLRGDTTSGAGADRGGGGERVSSDHEREATLDAAMAVFRYVHAKDAFEAYYKVARAVFLFVCLASPLGAQRHACRVASGDGRACLKNGVMALRHKAHLAKRLLLGRSASHELERSMIAKVRSCGLSATSGVM